MQVARVAPYRAMPAFCANKNLRERYINKIQNYPQDIEYLKTLAQEIGLSENEHYKLSSIIGVGELEHLLKNSKRHYFNPDTPPRGHLQESDLENLARREYGFNLHIHTTASDGTMTPLELINQAAEYADKLKEINPEKSFCIAITDHDTMEGAKEILRAVAENPERYKNLKIVLGVELSAAYRDKDKLNFPMSYELIGYCVNPYDKRADEYLKNLRLARINESKRVISEAAKIYPQYNFTYDEACKFAKNPKKGIDGFLYTIGWYFKSKAPEVDTYDLALKYLPSNEKKPPYVIYEADELYDAMKDATGFFGIAHPGRINVSDNKIRNDYVSSCDSQGKNAGYEIISGFVEYLKSTLGAKFRAIETNYQSYDDSLDAANKIINHAQAYAPEHQDSINWLMNFRNIAQKYGLLETGGLDTHSENPFLKK